VVGGAARSPRQEKSLVSANVVESPILAAPDEPRPTADTGLPGLRPAVAVLAPAIVAGGALAVHRFVPIRAVLPMSWMDKLPAALHPYPVLAAVQWAWRPLRPWAGHYGPLLAGALFLLCVWEVATVKLAWMPQPFFPSPDEILGGLLEDHDLLLVSTWHSLRLLLCGYATGVALGLTTGVLIGWFGQVRYWGVPVMKVLGPIPATALVPLVMLLSKEAFPCAVALIAFAVWFPMTILTSSGIANVRLSYLDVARTLGAGRLYLIFRVAIPSALPNVFIGAFMGLVVSFLALVVAETVGVQAGLGWYLKWQQGYAEYGKVYACLVIMAVFCSGLMTLLFKVRDRVLKWQKGVIRW
jgi:NitT/TauT family transport system permease protein